MMCFLTQSYEGEKKNYLFLITGNNEGILKHQEIDIISIKNASKISITFSSLIDLLQLRNIPVYYLETWFPKLQVSNE